MQLDSTPAPILLHKGCLSFTPLHSQSALGRPRGRKGKDPGHSPRGTLWWRGVWACRTVSTPMNKDKRPRAIPAHPWGLCYLSLVSGPGLNCCTSSSGMLLPHFLQIFLWKSPIQSHPWGPLDAKWLSPHPSASWFSINKDMRAALITSWWM